MTTLPPQAWRGYRRKEFPRAAWTVEGDVLHAIVGTEPVSLVSLQRFGDFDLALEWRLPPGGNSGILYRVDEQADAPWQSGPEMQLLDEAHPDARVPETACGALYGLEAPLDAPPCPSGLWNVARVRVRGTRVEHWLNGHRVVACDLAAAGLRARMAQSKFRDYPRFAREPQGHIVLQHHGTQAWFRKIRLHGAAPER